MINISIGSPGWIELEGKRVAVYLGDTYSLSDEVGQRLLDTCTTARIVFQSKVEDVKSSRVTNPTSIDLVTNLIAEGNVSKYSDDYSPKVPLDLGTHWSAVLNYLNSIEETYPVDLIMAKAVVDKFPNYKQVVNTYNRMVVEYSPVSTIENDSTAEVPSTTGVLPDAEPESTEADLSTIEVVEPKESTVEESSFDNATTEVSALVNETKVEEKAEPSAAPKATRSKAK